MWETLLKTEKKWGKIYERRRQNYFYTKIKTFMLRLKKNYETKIPRGKVILFNLYYLRQ